MYDWVQNVAKTYFDQNPHMKNTHQAVISRSEMISSPLKLERSHGIRPCEEISINTDPIKSEVIDLEDDSCQIVSVSNVHQRVVSKDIFPSISQSHTPARTQCGISSFGTSYVSSVGTFDLTSVVKTEVPSTEHFAQPQLSTAQIPWLPTFPMPPVTRCLPPSFGHFPLPAVTTSFGHFPLPAVTTSFGHFPLPSVTTPLHPPIGGFTVPCLTTTFNPSLVSVPLAPVTTAIHPTVPTFAVQPIPTPAVQTSLGTFSIPPVTTAVCTSIGPFPVAPIASGPFQSSIAPFQGCPIPRPAIQTSMGTFPIGPPTRSVHTPLLPFSVATTSCLQTGAVTFAAPPLDVSKDTFAERLLPGKYVQSSQAIFTEDGEKQNNEGSVGTLPVPPVENVQSSILNLEVPQVSTAVEPKPLSGYQVTCTTASDRSLVENCAEDHVTKDIERTSAIVEREQLSTYPNLSSAGNSQKEVLETDVQPNNATVQCEQVRSDGDASSVQGQDVESADQPLSAETSERPVTTSVQQKNATLQRQHVTTVAHTAEQLGSQLTTATTVNDNTVQRSNVTPADHRFSAENLPTTAVPKANQEIDATIPRLQMPAPSKLLSPGKFVVPPITTANEQAAVTVQEQDTTTDNLCSGTTSPGMPVTTGIQEISAQISTAQKTKAENVFSVVSCEQPVLTPPIEESAAPVPGQQVKTDCNALSVDPCQLAEVKTVLDHGAVNVQHQMQSDGNCSEQL